LLAQDGSVEPVSVAEGALTLLANFQVVPEIVTPGSVTGNVIAALGPLTNTFVPFMTNVKVMEFLGIVTVCAKHPAEKSKIERSFFIGSPSFL
jgi:hypothetical protein